MSPDPLERLLVDAQQIARDDLADVLAPYIGLTKSGEVVLTEDAAALSAANRVIAVLLSLWAAHLLELRPTPGATPSDLVTLSGLPAGTVRPKLSELSRQRLVAKDGHQYVIPMATVRLAAAQLSAARVPARRKAS